MLEAKTYPSNNQPDNKEVTQSAASSSELQSKELHSKEPHAKELSADTAESQQWQKRLLPLMAGMMISLTIFFFAASLFQLYFIQNAIENSPELTIPESLKQLSVTKDNELNKTMLEFEQWKALVALEGHMLERRYHQANVLLMARIWVRYLGFVTGMILAILGAVFVLGKMKEEKTTLEAKSSDLSGTLSTTSPGLVLVTLGTIMMLTTILSHHQIDVRDGPLYTALPYAQIAANKNMSPPEDVSHLTLPDKPVQEEHKPQDMSQIKPKSNTENEALEALLTQ